MLEVPGYQVQRELGRGGMAVVYLATQLSLKRLVALKVLDRGVPDYAEFERRFVNEAHTLAGLRHRNIVTVYDVVESEDADFIVMEFLGEGSLGGRLAVGLEVQRSLAILAQLGSALDAAHASGIVHRDIKPENVLFRDADTPVLTDFGIARHTAPESQRVTQEGLSVGTPSYMSPEQISGDTIDGRADQYSLGAMFFELLTGKPPFQAESTSDLLRAHLVKPVPTLPLALAPLQPAVDRMLAKSPDDRYPDLAAMLADVSRMLLRAPELLRAPPGAPAVSATERLHQLGFPTTGVHSGLTSETRLMSGVPLPGAVSDRMVSERLSAAPSERRSRLIAWGLAATILVALVALAVWQRPSSIPAAETATAVARPPAVVLHQAPSIAVLPFSDLSQRKDQAYMSDGLAEELLTLLTQVPGLRVIARTSSFSFKDKSVDVATIGKALAVEYVLQGSVRRVGDKLRITSQLVRAADNTQLWSQSFDRTVGDVFAVQEEIAAAVVSEMKITLMSGPPRLQRTSPEAYALFLRARQSGRQGTLAGRQQAVTLYKKVLALDPAYAPAWLGLSTSVGNLANDGGMPLDQGFALAREAADQALAIDPNSSRAHAQRAYVAFNFDNDLPLAARRIQSALSLDPDDLGGLLTAAGLSLALGRLEQATALNRYVVSRDPVNPTAHYNLGVALLFGGHDAEAIASWRQALALSPDFAGAWVSIGAAQLSLQQPEAALASIRNEKSEILRAIGLPMAYHALGQAAKADAALAELERVHGDAAAFNIAYVHALRGEPDQAFEWLERAVRNKDTGLPDIIYEPNLASLHADPRWLPLLRRLGRAPEQLAAVSFEARPPR